MQKSPIIERDRQLKVLLSYHTDPTYMSPLSLSTNQVNCGPYYPNKDTDGKAISRRTPKGIYDIREIIESLPDDQKPDLLVVKADATRNNFPTHIGDLKIPSVLIIGDTQHQKDPLQTLIRYAATEKYTVYVADHVRRHLHYFIEAGINNVYWAPAINLKKWNIPFIEEKKFQLSFVGQTGKFHPYRNIIINGLKEREDIDFNCLAAPQEDASKIYALSQTSLNVSMNGDLNLRAFEVMTAGGLLLTDTLRTQAGMELLFDPGVHLETFSSTEELYDKALFYAKNPIAALKIARNGFIEIQHSHSPERKHQQIIDLAFNRWLDPSWNAKRDKRSIFCKSPDTKTFFNRIRNYEYIQQKQLEGEFPTLLFSSEANSNLTCDVADLFHVTIKTLAEEKKPLFIKAGVYQDIEIVRSAKTTDVDILVLSSKETNPDKLRPLLESTPKKILVEDYHLVDEKNKQEVINNLRSERFLKENDAPAIFVNLN